MLLIFWETGARLNLWRPNLLPAPSSILHSLTIGFSDGSLAVAIQVSLTRMVIAFIAALFLGAIFGVILGAVPLLRKLILPVLTGLQTLPNICWQPLGVVWFGISEFSILFVTAISAIIAITIAVADGVVAIDPLTIRATRMMGLTGIALWTRVLLPAAMPSLAAGAKLGWAFAWRGLLAAEVLSSAAKSAGLGQALNQSRSHNNMSQVFAVMTLLVLIGVIADQLVFARIERMVRKNYGLVSA